MITFKIKEANDQSYRDYELMYVKANGDTKGSLTKEVFMNKLRNGKVVKLRNCEFKVAN